LLSVTKVVPVYCIDILVR